MIIYLSSGITSRESSEQEKKATLSVVREENRHLNNSVMILTYALMNGRSCVTCQVAVIDFHLESITVLWKHVSLTLWGFNEDLVSRVHLFCKKKKKNHMCNLITRPVLDIYHSAVQFCKLVYCAYIIRKQPRLRCLFWIHNTSTAQFWTDTSWIFSHAVLMLISVFSLERRSFFFFFFWGSCWELFLCVRYHFFVFLGTLCWRLKVREVLTNLKAFFFVSCVSVCWCVVCLLPFPPFIVLVRPSAPSNSHLPQLRTHTHTSAVHALVHH